MAYNPGVSFFLPFYELDPLKQSQCIFFTQKGERCKWRCQQGDNMRAVTLHKDIMAMPNEAVSLDLLQDYVLCNCCRSGRARHRDRIEDICLLIPLAQRWQDEIWTSTLGHISKLYIPPASPSYYRPNARTFHTTNVTPSKPVASSSCYQYGSPGYSVIAESSAGQPRYSLRSRMTDISTQSTSTQPPLSEFRPHITDPLPSDFVSWKILERLDGRDSETGSLYIFDRAASPGHVKIGWTANSVSRRLEDWSKCGYTPNLLFSVHHVPHAQRAETFAHHELISEWRRERQCKVCGKSHQEWFKIGIERAAQVVGDWADFMKIAEPYDSEGWLENRWREVIEMMDRNREVVTAEKLLKHYEATLVEEVTLVEELVDLGDAQKTEDEVDFGPGPMIECLVAPKEAAMRVGPPLIEQPTLPKETLQLSEALAEQLTLLENPLPKLERQPESDALFERKPTPKTEPPFRVEPKSKIKPLLNTDSLFKIESLPTSEVVHNEVLAPGRTVIKTELPTGQALFPTSPLLQSTTSLHSSPSLQGTKTSQSTGTEETSPMQTITNSDTKISIFDTSFNPEINSSVSTLATSATPGEEITHANARTSTDASTTTGKSPPVSSLYSSPKSNLCDSSATTSASPRSKIDSASNSPAQQPVKDNSETSICPSTDGELEAEVLDAHNSIITLCQQQQNIVDGDSQARPESGILGHDAQSLKEGIKSHDRDESTAAAADETGSGTGSGTGSDGWDADETLVEDQGLGWLQEATLEIVEGLCDEISDGKLGIVLKGSKEVKVLENEAPSVVEAAAQA